METRMTPGAGPRRRGARAAPLALALALATGLAACGYRNPHGRQDTPPLTRLTTVPPGATVAIPRLHLSLVTPCDLPYEIDEDDEIIVTLEGHAPYRGRLGTLPQVARGTHQLRLTPDPPR